MRHRTLVADLLNLRQALSVTMRKHTLEAAARNVLKLRTAVDRCKQTNADRLTTEYNRLVSGLQARGLSVMAPCLLHGLGTQRMMCKRS